MKLLLRPARPPPQGGQGHSTPQTAPSLPAPTPDFAQLTSSRQPSGIRLRAWHQGPEPSQAESGLWRAGLGAGDSLPRPVPHPCGPSFRVSGSPPCCRPPAPPGSGGVGLFGLPTAGPGSPGPAVRATQARGGGRERREGSASPSLRDLDCGVSSLTWSYNGARGVDGGAGDPHGASSPHCAGAGGRWPPGSS